LAHGAARPAVTKWTQFAPDHISCGAGRADCARAGEQDSVMLSLRSTSGIAATALVALAASMPSARAQARLTAQYTISVAGISIGRGDFTAEIAGGRYAAVGSGRAAGFLRILVSGEAAVAARGVLSEDKSVPSNFTATMTSDDERSSVNMTLDNGVVKDLTAESSDQFDDRVAVTDAHRVGVIDPVSAMLVPAGSAVALSPQACQRTLPIFDGRRRYDLKLSFKRMDKVETDKGYRGPVAVCAAAFRPIAGHRAGSMLVKYLSDGRDLELWLAPISGTNVLGPYRLSVAHMIGSLLIEAVRYEATMLPMPPATTTSGGMTSPAP
jgi:hypothetical protein